MKKMTKARFTITETTKGYSISFRDINYKGEKVTYKETFKTLEEVDSWIWNMADNSDHYRAVNYRLNEVFRDGVQYDWYR